MNQSTKNMKKSVLQDQKVDDTQQRKRNEENLKIPLNFYRSYGRIVQQSMLEEIAPMMSQIEFLKKNCPEGTKIEEFAVQACSFFKYELFKQGQIVFNYGEYGDKVYLILQGEVGVFVQRSKDEIAIDKEVIDTYRSNLNPFDDEQLDYETVFRRKKTQFQLQMDALLARGQNPFELNNMYFKDGICQFKRVFQFYSGQAFGDMALSSDKPRTASILVLSEELQVLTMNRFDFKSVGDRSIKEKNQTFEYFLSIFVGVSKFIVTKFIQYFQKIEFAPQTLLWKEGDDPKFFFLVVRGRVEIFRSYDEDTLHSRHKEPSIFNKKIKPKKKVTLCQLSDNSFVGEAELLENNPVRLYSCMTSDNTLAFYMESDSFNIVKKQYPDFVKILKEKSFMIKSYLIRREKYLFENIKKQDEAMEKLQYPDSTNTERVTVNELFRDISKINLRILRSKQKPAFTTTDIVQSNEGISKNSEHGRNSMFVFDKKQLEELKQKNKTSSKAKSQIPPIILQKSTTQSNMALECQVLKSYRRMRYQQFQADREVCLKIKSTLGTSITTQLRCSSHDSSFPNVNEFNKRLRTLQDFYFAKTFITANNK